MAAKRAAKRSGKKRAAKKAGRKPAAVTIPSPDEVLGEVGASLNEKQRAFAHAYAAEPNRTKAYMLAYGVESENVAVVNARRLLLNPAVAELVNAIRAPILEQYDATAERTIEELAYLVFLDPAELYDEAGALLPIRLMKPHVRRAIASIEYTKFGPKVKLVSKEAMVGLLMRYHGLLKDKVEHSADESFTALMAQAFGR